MEQVKTDIIIFGAGIAGLWTYHILKKLGYQVVLIEKEAIGGTQSMASQGMIHGGQRYALQGKLNQHSESIANMPKIWANCLKGKETPDLSAAKILSKEQYLWSPGGFSSNVTSFFASKAMNSRVDALEKENWPEIFKAAQKFKGKIYCLNEVVLDIASVSKALASINPQHIYMPTKITYNVEGQKISNVYLQSKNQELEVFAEKYIFCAGKGNEEITELLSPEKKLTQRRPLKQVLVRNLPYDLYAHCITMDPRPRVTISAHPDNKGNFIWYLGGLVAVKHIESEDHEAINFACQELTKLFPWINWQEKEWATLKVDRAEPYTSTGFLPDGPALKYFPNAILAWPTKLTFAPAVANQIVRTLEKENILPAQDAISLELPIAEFKSYPWENLKWQKV